MHIRSTGSRNAFYEMTQANSWSHTWRGDNPWKPSSDATSISYQFAEFERLGTYVVEYTLRAKHFSETGDCDTEIDTDTNPDSFCGTETYIFHVGPMADVEVRDGGARPDVGADQYAITIAALHNGPDHQVDAAVTVDLSSLPAGVTVASHMASDGTYDSSAGKWDLGALKSAGNRRSAGKPEAATLTLVLAGADAASATATATIANDADYTVCIGSYGRTLQTTNQTDCKSESLTTNVWHSAVCVNTAGGEVDTTYTTAATCDVETDREWTEDVCASSDGSVRTGRTEAECGGWFQGTVYDYDTGNNTATITAQAGTGGVGEGIPTLQAPAAHAPAVGVTWSEVESLYGVPVKDYDVQWSPNGVSGWTQLETELTLPELFDITIQSGQTRYYRVRAVNQAGVPGPWSAPMRAMAVDPGAPSVSISETELTIEEGETAEYRVTLGARPLSNVTVNINGRGVVSPNPSRVTFTTSNYHLPQTVELTANQDNNAVNEEIEVTHTISSSDGVYSALSVDPVAVTVIDDDAGVSIASDRQSINEGESIEFILKRVGNTNNAITVSVNVSQQGDYLASGQAGSRTIDIAASATENTFQVATDNDSVQENPGSVSAILQGGTGYLVESPAIARVSVADDDGPPGQPGNLTAEELDQSVLLTWSTAPSPSSAIESYSYRVRRTSGGSWDPDWTVITGSGPDTISHTVRDLDNGTDYTIQVRARNGTGDGTAAQVTANPKAKPDSPEVTVTSRHQSLLVNWNVADDGGRDITEYQIQWKSGTQVFDTSRQATATTAEHTIPSLTNGTEYRVRVRARNEVDWSNWSAEASGTPTPRPLTTLSITTDAEDGVDEPFRVTFTFTDEDHDGTQYGVKQFDVDDIQAHYSAPSHYEFTLADFRKEDNAGLVYSALVDRLLDGNLRIRVAAGAAKSTQDGQESQAAVLNIKVNAPEATVPAGTQIWSAEMTVGEFPGNAVGYIDHQLTQWTLNQTIGSLSGDDGNQFIYSGTNYRVGEVSYVRAWNVMIFVLCPGLDGADARFDLYLDDTVDGRTDLSLSFDPEKANTSRFTKTVDGNSVSCVEYHWEPHKVDWTENGKVNVRLIR